MHRGEVGKSILQLEMDIRHVMEPNTAINLKVKLLNIFIINNRYSDHNNNNY